MRQSIAQWEKQEYLVLSLPHAKTDWKPYLDEILNSYEKLIKVASKYQKVLLIAPCKADFARFAHLKNLSFFCHLTNDTWIRDYGAIDVREDGQILAQNFIFNAWGGKFDSHLDNALNHKLYAHLGYKLVDEDFILEGGSIDVNGQGVMLSTANCLFNENRNSNLSKDEIKNKLKSFFGIQRLIILEDGFIKGDDTDSHVDTLARFISPNTIAYMACDDEKDLHFAPLKRMKLQLEKTGFELLPLPLPKPIFYDKTRLGATYTNFIFLNGALIVPTYGDEADSTVLARLQNALPSLDVVGVDARVFLRQCGSLHCSSQNIYQRN